MAWTIYPSREKPHTRYTTNMKGPTFLLVTHFTPKIKIITFINERGKIFPSEIWKSVHHTRDRCQVDLNTSLEWWKCNRGETLYTKHFTKKNTRRLQLTTAQSGTSPTSSAVFLKHNLLIFSCPNVSVHAWACTICLSVIGLTCLLSLLWLSLHALHYV